MAKKDRGSLEERRRFQRRAQSQRFPPPQDAGGEASQRYALDEEAGQVTSTKEVAV